MKEVKVDGGVSLVIPVFRCAKILPELVRQIDDGVKRQIPDLEVIFINDCSPDDTWETVKQLSVQYPYIKGLSLRKNKGQHSAIMAGLNHATKSIIVTMDDDLQHSPYDVPRLFEEVQRGADLCYTIFEKRQHGFFKVLGSRFANLVATILIEKPYDLYLSPFRAFRSEIKDEIIKYQGPYPYIDGLLLSVTNNITTVMVQHHARFEGETTYSFKKMLKLWLHMATNFSVFPLRFASLVGGALSLLGFLFAAFLIVEKFYSKIPVEGWTSLIVVILVIGGVQLIALGLIGEYLGRAFIMLNKKPQFTIREKLKL